MTFNDHHNDSLKVLAMNNPTTPSEREEFEAAALANNWGYRDEKHGFCFWGDYPGNAMWTAWQAARAAIAADRAKNGRTTT